MLDQAANDEPLRLGVHHYEKWFQDYKAGDRKELSRVLFEFPRGKRVANKYCECYLVNSPGQELSQIFIFLLCGRDVQLEQSQILNEADCNEAEVEFSKWYKWLHSQNLQCQGSCEGQKDRKEAQVL